MHHRILVILMILALGVAMPLKAKAGESPANQTSGIITLADGDCAIAVRSGGVDFGVWTWNGNEYKTDSPHVSSVVVYHVVPPNNRTCQITIETDGLVHTAEGRSAFIEPEHFAVQMVQTASAEPEWVYFDANGVVTVPWKLRRVNTNGVSIALMSVPNDAPPGRYEGEFTFTISNGP